jgi:16S rRNA (adenine1518-N6/adenine1519-N6)-dimethyltransferase
MIALPPVRELLAAHGIRADKRLGQHFLFDLNLTARIARAAGDVSAGTTVEIGPGPGGLTRALLDAGATVIAVERDERLRPVLVEIARAHPGRLSVVWGDALAVDAGTLGAPPRRIVANLPYNVGTELLLGWLGDVGAFESLTLMFQNEVADRLAAAPGSNAYGRLSVLAQWLCEVRKLFTVAASAFVPPPQVDSAVVQLVPRAAPACPADRAALEAVTAAAFGQRRKMLRQSLKALAAARGLDATAWCAAAGIDPTARAETLSVAQFCALARTLDPAR